MKYFYCQSYLAFNFSLRYKDVCVITSQKDIIKACDYLNIKYIEHTSFTTNDFVVKKKAITAEIGKIVDAIDDGEFHFSHSQYAIFCFLLAVSAKKVNKKVIFHDFEYEYSKASFSFSLNYFKIKASQIILNAMYSSILEIRLLLKHKFVLSLNKKTIQEFDIKSYKENEYNQIVEDTMTNFKMDNAHTEKILFIDQGLTNKINFYTEHVDQLMEYLRSVPTIVKAHPIHTPKGFFSGFKLLPQFLPVEMFFNGIKGVVISSYSNALLLASTFPNIKAVALLYMMKDATLKAEIKKKYQKESSGKIIFVNSLEELQTLVDNND